MTSRNPEVIILTGPAGVGKSTVAGHLRGILPGTITISGDDLRAFAPDDARSHLGGGSTYRAAAALATAYLSMGAPRVIFDYVLFCPGHVDYFRSSFAGEAPIYLFTLWAPLDVVVARERARPGRVPLGDRVDEGYKELEENLERMGHVVPNVEGDVQVAAHTIHELVLAGIGRVTG
jgi:energy-coupling factor transporter ATP-binding protein EcfA2